MVYHNQKLEKQVSKNTSKHDRLKSLADADGSHMPFNYFTNYGFPIMKTIKSQQYFL